MNTKFIIYLSCIIGFFESFITAQDISSALSDSSDMDFHMIRLFMFGFVIALYHIMEVYGTKQSFIFYHSLMGAVLVYLIYLVGFFGATTTGLIISSLIAGIILAEAALKLPKRYRAFVRGSIDDP